MGNAEKEIQVTIEQAREQIELGAALDRLHSNKDFQKVIKGEYLGKEPSRLTYLLSDPSQQDEVSRASIFTSLQGVSELHGFFRKIEAGTMIAQRTLNDHLSLDVGEEL